MSTHLYRCLQYATGKGAKKGPAVNLSLSGASENYANPLYFTHTDKTQAFAKVGAPYANSGLTDLTSWIVWTWFFIVAPCLVQHALSLSPSLCTDRQAFLQAELRPAKASSMCRCACLHRAHGMCIAAAACRSGKAPRSSRTSA